MNKVEINKLVNEIHDNKQKNLLSKNRLISGSHKLMKELTML